MTERTFDWRSSHDERSFNYSIRTLIGTHVDRTMNLFRASTHRLDQGSEGACVGFGITNELIGHPKPVRIGNKSIADEERYALQLYRDAKLIDAWPGEDYDGTSVLAGMKIIHEAGLIDSYYWAFGINDVIDALCTPVSKGGGPIVIGIPWFESMYDTLPNGIVHVGGAMVGGHCILLTGYHPRMRFSGPNGWEYHEVIKWRNSWGRGYGRNGDGFIKIHDLEMLLSNQGEACIPVGRKSARIIF